MRPSVIPLVLPLLALVASCSGDRSTGLAKGDPPPAEGFTVTRDDGSTFDIEGPFTVECARSEDIPDATVLRAYVPRQPEEEGVYFEFSVVPDRVGADGREYELPYSETYDDPELMVFFLVDPRDDNELSATQGTVGSVHVVSATCDPVAHVVLEVDAELGSEFGNLDGVEVVGEIDVGADG